MKKSRMEKEMQELLQRPGAYLVLPEDMTLKEAASMGPSQLLAVLVENRKPKEGWEPEEPVLPERLEYTGSGGRVAPWELPVVGEEMVVDPAGAAQILLREGRLMPTNAQAMRAGKVPCEWNPYREQLARLSDGWHGKAELVGGKVSKDSSKQDRRLRVCRDCALRPAVEEAVRTPGKTVCFREIE